MLKVMLVAAVSIRQRVQRLAEADEVTWNQAGALVDQLIERMLPIGARLAPVDRAGFIVHRSAFQRHVLAVALHGQLLQVGGKPFQVLLVGQHRHR